jgi:hypothetical protein
VSEVTPEQIWEKRLNALLVAEAKEADAAAKFKIQQDIVEAKEKLGLRSPGGFRRFSPWALMRR